MADTARILEYLVGVAKGHLASPSQAVYLTTVDFSLKFDMRGARL
jgi:hypothetical protein